MLRILLLLVFCLALKVRAQVVIPVQARIMQTDDLGNVYIVRADNTLTRYNAQGDSSAFYRSVRYGDIGFVDATNPLEPLVYFPKFSRVVVLDRMLAPKSEINLQQAGMFSPPALAYSADGGLWVYDPFNARLRKLGLLGENVQSADLRQQLDYVPVISALVERNHLLYATDSIHGVLVFDRYGSLLSTLPILGLNQVQVINNQVLYQRGDTLYAFHTENFRESKIPLLPGTLDARYNSGQLYLKLIDGVRIQKAE